MGYGRRLQDRVRTAPWPAWALGAAALLHAAWAYGAKLSWVREQVPGRDWGLYTEILAQTRLGGPWLPSAALQVETGAAGYLQEHFAPTLLLLALPFQALGRPELLLLVHALAPATAALLLYKLARAWGAGAGASLGASVLWLLNPLCVDAALDLPQLFHHDALIPPLALGAALAWTRSRPAVAWGALLLLLGLKENVPPLVALCGAALWWRGRRREGLGMLILSGLFLAWVPWQAFDGQGSRHVRAVLGEAAALGLDEHLGLLAAWSALALLAPALLGGAWAAMAVPLLWLHARSGLWPMPWHAWPVLSVLGLGLASAVAGPWALRRPKAMGLGLAVLAALSVAAGWAKRPAPKPALPAPASAAEVDALVAAHGPEALWAVSDRYLVGQALKRPVLWAYQAEHADRVLLDLAAAPLDPGGQAALNRLQLHGRLVLREKRGSIAVLEVQKALSSQVE